MRQASRRNFHFIYKTTCLVTNRYYIGMHSTDDMNDGYLGSGRFIRNSIKHHGEKNHQREVVEMCESRDALRKREEEIIDENMLKDKMCMNLIVGGGRSGDFTDFTTTRERMSRAKLGKKQHPEWVKARAEGLKGHIVTAETREKISKKLTGHKFGMTGHTHSEETLKKMSAAKKGKPSPMLGRKHSEETRQKMSIAQKITRARKAKNG